MLVKGDPSLILYYNSLRKITQGLYELTKMRLIIVIYNYITHSGPILIGFERILQMRESTLGYFQEYKFVQKCASNIYLMNFYDIWVHYMSFWLWHQNILYSWLIGVWGVCAIVQPINYFSGHRTRLHMFAHQEQFSIKIFPINYPYSFQ